MLTGAPPGVRQRDGRGGAARPRILVEVTCRDVFVTDSGGYASVLMLMGV